MSKTKQNRHETVATVMLTGKSISIDEFHLVFKDTDLEKLMYRLPMFISMIRKDGGIIKPIRDGRRVIAYQLINYMEFNKNGRYVGWNKPDSVPEVELVAPVESNE